VVIVQKTSPMLASFCPGVKLNSAAAAIFKRAPPAR
jgi:hypothetical protein